MQICGFSVDEIAVTARKEIWLICQNAGSKYHGMVFRPYYIATELVKQGHQVTVWTSAYSHLLTTLPILGTKSSLVQKIDGVRYIWLKTRRYGQSRSLGRFLSFFEFPWKLALAPRRDFPPPSTIIVSSPALFPILVGLLWSRMYRARFILEIRDIWPLTLAKVGRVSRLHPVYLLMQWVERLGYRSADFVVSVAKYAYKHFEANGMKAGKFRFIPNGLLIDEADNPAPIDPAVETAIPRGKIIVGYLGSIGEANEVITIIQAAEALKSKTDIHFVFFGSGAKKAELLDYCRNHNLTNVNFFEPVKRDQVHSLIKQFDICAFASKETDLYEFGFSFNKLFDYMYSGKPLVAAISSPYKPIAEANCGVTVNAGDYHAMAAAILKMADMDREQREALGRNGAAFVREHHSYRRLAEEYATLLR